MPLLDGVVSIRDMELERRRTLIRLDLDCPLTEGESPEVADDARIRAAVPTVKLALERGAKVVVAAHLGRPRPNGKDAQTLSLEPVGARLSELLGVDLFFPHEDCVGDAARKLVRDLRDGQIALLENVRFHAEEERDDDGFAQQLAELGEIYVNDALSVSSRAHASVSALAKKFRVRGMGLQLEQEVLALSKTIEAPTRPFVGVLGGISLGAQADLLGALLERVDTLLVGGALATSFLAAQGLPVGASPIEEDRLAFARTVMERARFGRNGRKVELLLPTDVVAAGGLEAGEKKIYDAERIPAGLMALDVGPRTTERFAAALADAKTVLWCGALGAADRPLFAEGSHAVARAIADVDGFTIACGEDTVAAVKGAGDDALAKFKHVSLAGGAARELLEGKRLPGLEALRGGMVS
jgi:phosphoglycerate kinase